MRTSRSFCVLASALLALLVALPAHAVSNRIFMSTNGNDASDCANPLTPCLTFAGAIAQVNTGGEVIAEATGGYGLLNVTQAMTISGPPGVVIYSGLGVTVNAPGATVVLRGLTIDGTGATGNGITVTAVGSLFVESCVIANFQGTTANGNGIYSVSTDHLFMKDTVVRNIGNDGVVLASESSMTASIQHCKFDQGSSAIAVTAVMVVNVRHTTVTGMTGEALSADFGGELNIDNCVIANNNVGIVALPDGVIRVSNSTVTDNGTGILAIGVVLSRSNNTVEGNAVDGTFTGTYAAK